MSSRLLASLRRRALAAALPALAAVCSSTVSGEALEPIRSVEGVSEYRLANGMQVLLFPDPSKDTITVNITYLVGSKHENYGETGMAHLLEHLLFKGSPRFPNIAKELTERGARANGTTWLERTNYYATFKATEENLAWALDLEADRMVNSFVAQADLDSEMTVVRNEFEAGENNPSRILRQRVTATAFEWHNYGKSTIGARSDIENVSIENLQAFYRMYYQPDNASLVVAGSFEPASAIAMIERYFSVIPKPDRVLPKQYTIDPTQDGEREVVVRRNSDTQLAVAAYRIPSVSHEDMAALDLWADILGAPATGRLHRKLVEPGWAIGASAWATAQREPHLFYSQITSTLETDLDRAGELLLEVVEGAAAEPIQEQELERARRRELQSYERLLNDTDRFAIRLSEWIAAGDWRLFFLHRDRLEGATLESVQAAAERYFKPSNRTVGRFYPSKEPVRVEIPATPDLDELLVDYRGRPPIAEGEAFDPEPERIAQRLQTQRFGGLEAAMLPKRTRGETVQLDLKLAWGNVESLFGRNEIGSLVASMLLRGSERLSRQEIQDELDRLKARGNIAGSGDHVLVKYQTTRENLSELIALLRELLATPSFPEDEFKQVVAARIARLKADSTDPRQLANRLAASVFDQHPVGDVRRAASFAEEIDAIESTSLEDLRLFHQEFYGAGNATLSIVGDFDLGEMAPVLRSAFGDWEVDTEYERAIDPYFEVAAQRITSATPDKPNAVLIGAVNFEMTRSDPDYPAVVIVDYMLGGGFISSRLATRIRQQDGLSYGVGSYVRVDRLSSNSVFNAWAIAAPDNVERVVEALKEELGRAAADGFGDDELQEAKRSYLDRRRVNLSDDSILAGKLRSDLEFGQGPEDERTFIDAIAALDTEAVNVAMRRYFSPDRITLVKVGDFKGEPND